MTLAELKTILSSTNLPVTYGYFPEENKPSAPYIEYQVAYTSNFGADNKVRKKVNNIDIFLFTAKKDETTEALLENALDGASIFYNKTETYLDEARLYQIIYEVKIYG